MITNLNQLDINKFNLPTGVNLLLSKEDFCIAGGYIRDIVTMQKPHDIDLFYIGGKDFNAQAANSLATKYFPKSKVYTTKNATTITSDKHIPIQIITKWVFSSSNEVIEHFDFSIVQGAIFYSILLRKLDGICSDNFYSDLAAKRLRYTRPIDHDLEPGGSLIRMMKFIRKGFNPTIETMATIIDRIYIMSDKNTEQKDRLFKIVQLLHEAYPSGTLEQSYVFESELT